MSRYLGPAIAYAALTAAAAILLFLLDQGVFGADGGVLAGPLPLLLMIAGYLGVSLWWVVRASRPARPIWPHLLAVWLPAAPPAAALIGVLGRTADVDNAVMLFEIALYPALGMVAICGAGALRLVLGVLDRRRLG